MERAPKSTERLDQKARFRFFLMPVELHVVKPSIVPGFLEQLPVRSNFLDVAVVHDYDLIGRQDGGEPMCDRDDGASGGEHLQCALNLLF